jgi:TIR domain
MSEDSPLSGDARLSSGPLESDRPPLSKDVFISYASQDAAVANSVVEALEGQGIRCWIAPRNVTPGEFYAGVIVHAIDAAKAIVLILSQHSGVSPHVVREVERASSKRHPVISLRIDLAALPADLEYFLNTSQWLDASAGEPSRVFPKLVEAVRKILAAAPATTGSGSAGAPLPPLDEARAAKRPFNRPLAGAVGLIVILMCVFAIDKFWLSKHVAAGQPAAQIPVVVAFAPPPHSIAVLPFVNMSGDASQDYFSDGITEELLNSLSRLNELQVVARTSSFSFKGRNVDVSTIAHKLNVGAILEGSVRWRVRTCGSPCS